MKITIVGAGAIGGLAGAYMTEAGYDVTLVDRWTEHVAALASRGLTIDGVRGDKHVVVRAVTPEALQRTARSGPSRNEIAAYARSRRERSAAAGS